ncbi:unnamed protein product [Caenorhabditis angaria]|uniref:Ribosomal RNA-processing protein 14/surfeit locus protein 6 C-terminal domain-containing protein n=1 Tax=Caenorhabditis angaria TaxID=860376 RepID=A0A9P1IFT3_9PELO|nr:unnamed protein product [Caenorhabditis angaria]
MSGTDSDEAILALENKMLSYCNLVPVGCWGFDDDVKESLKQRKHSLVNRQLSKKERKQFSAQQKQQLARNLGLVPNTVQEVIEWMSTSKELSKVQPVKAKDLPKKPETQPKPLKNAQKPAEPEESEESDDEAETAAENPEESENEEEDQDSEEEEDDDSTDEEIEPEEAQKLEPAVKKLKLSSENQESAQKSLPKTNDKIDKEIEKLENGEDNESPEIKRQIALLRLQKKLKDMKQERKGSSKTAKLTPAMTSKLAEEKRLKRRESKMKLKQRRAEEKKQKEEVKQEKTVKNEGAQDDSENTVKTNGISFNKLKFEIKEDKQRGKKERIAKKDRGLKLTGRDYKSLIAKVEETRATIAKVREADPHKATIMEDELKWEKTMKRAEGGKVKDNLQMLKKALAKKNKLKEKKKEKWENREKKIENEKETKQDKRKGNLQKRIDDVKKRKLAKLRKKGRML